jgi:hypothetical protein
LAPQSWHSPRRSDGPSQDASDVRVVGIRRLRAARPPALPRLHLSTVKLHACVAHEPVESDAVLALARCSSCAYTSSVIFESAWPTWLITHFTSKRLARSAIEMYVRRRLCGVVRGSGGTAGYAGRPPRGGGQRVPVSRRVSAAGVRFSVILFPPRSWAPLAVGLPDETCRPDPDGVTAFRTHELRPGWVPSLPRGRRCSPAKSSP